MNSNTRRRWGADSREWAIYVLHEDGEDFYVGRTFQVRERYLQHRKRFGPKIEIRVVQTGTGHREAIEAERSWMERLSGEGVTLANKVKGGSGCWLVDEESRQKYSAAGKANWKNPTYLEKQRAGLLAAFKDPGYRERKRIASKAMWADPVIGTRLREAVMAAHKGKSNSTETRARMSRAQKGLKKEFTPEGRIGAEVGRFKAGQNNFNRLSEDAKERIRAASRKNWENITPEERTRRALERNRKMWANRDAKARIEIGNKIREGQIKKHGIEAIRERARFASATAAQRPGLSEELSKRAKDWWANLTTEAKADYIARRAPKIAAAKAARKLAREVAA